MDLSIGFCLQTLLHKSQPRPLVHIWRNSESKKWWRLVFSSKHLLSKTLASQNPPKKNLPVQQYSRYKCATSIFTQLSFPRRITCPGQAVRIQYRCICSINGACTPALWSVYSQELCGTPSLTWKIEDSGESLEDCWWAFSTEIVPLIIMMKSKMLVFVGQSPL